MMRMTWAASINLRSTPTSKWPGWKVSCQVGSFGITCYPMRGAPIATVIAVDLAYLIVGARADSLR
jgi:hypothetical protein